MEARELSVKLYMADPDGVELASFIPVFHEWIKHKRIDEALIDVADYSHVPNGPGVLLVCHEAHYGIDELDGRPGLAFARKRGGSGGSFEDRLVHDLRKVLQAASLLEREHSPAVSFRGNEILLGVQNRLLAPNDDETLAAVRPALERVAARLFDGVSAKLTREGSEREMFSVRIESDAGDDVETLLARLAG